MDTPYNTKSRQIPTSGLRKPSELADSTSYFRPKDLIALNIVYINDDTILLPIDQQSNTMLYREYDDNLLIKGMNRDQLLHMWHDESLGSHLNNEQRTLAEHVSKVLIQEMASAGKRERSTDAFVNYLLGALKFNLFPLSLELKPDCKFKIHTTIVTSEADFGVYKRRLFAIVDEDKHIHNVEHATGWGECQIAGEVLAAAYSNHQSINKEYRIQTINAVRVIGTRFTFYRAEITYEYIESLANGFPESGLSIYRYPPWNGSPGVDNIPCLDYSNPDQREHILSIMITLRNRVLVDEIAK